MLRAEPRDSEFVLVKFRARDLEIQRHAAIQQISLLLFLSASWMIFEVLALVFCDADAIRIDERVSV